MNDNHGSRFWLLFVLIVLALLAWIFYPGGSSYYKSLEKQLALSTAHAKKPDKPESKPAAKSQPEKQHTGQQQTQQAQPPAQQKQVVTQETVQPKSQPERIPSWQRTQNQEEEALWEKARRENTPQAYQHYLSSYPEGRYTREAYEALKNILPAAPRNLTSYRNQQSKSILFWATGKSSGTVWGGADGIYTDDSILEKAAVHAGKLKVGESGIISVTILPGQSRYNGNTQNSISTQNYASWQGSFSFN